MNKEFIIGEKVCLIAKPPYLKTAEPMPMLRPPDLVELGEEGTIVDRRPGGYWSVRFQRGAFLVDTQYLESAVIAHSHLPQLDTSLEQPSIG